MFLNRKHVTNVAASSTVLVDDSHDILVIVENIQMKYCYIKMHSNTW